MSGSVSFDRAADYYDQTRAVPDSVMTQLVPVLVAQLPRHQLTLEIGIGTGRIALPLAVAGVRIVGVDISSAMLRKLIAKRDATWPQVAVADATRLPFRDATFGSAIASHVLHLITDWRAAVAEIVRVTRPGGVFIASRGGRDRPQWLQEVNEHFFREAGNPPWPPGANSIEDVDSHMRDLGVAPRSLPTLGLETLVSIEQVIANLEAGYWSACWEIGAEIRSRAGAATREWARQKFGDLNAVRHTSWESSTWHAYDLRE